MKTRRRGRSEVAAQPGHESPAPSATGLGDRGTVRGDRNQEIVLRARGVWPVWARVVVSLAIIYHLTAVFAGAVGVPPSSVLERTVADLFTAYYDLVDFGYAYRFYTEPPPTPVVTALLEFSDGRAAETVRLPGREVPGPPMRHQRQLALANALFLDVREAHERTGERSRSRLAQGYARHLCATRPGCQSVTLHLRYHLIPDIEQVREATDRPGSPGFDLFAESLFSTPEWIGEFPCAGL
jgi:hypothetical protein